LSFLSVTLDFYHGLQLWYTVLHAKLENVLRFEEFHFSARCAIRLYRYRIPAFYILPQASLGGI
jgi:hypothetical protein